ncbi:Peptidase C50 separase [Venturia nashicola]|uniref:separase n=1 Tax=Venturia nashicola TaxID=86259 RepID=A0A4Z1NZY2_9PEZI|nr:Peptidase C50 separase [Venturia nashicola]TLD32499.1 Peptidase C50 separase [Venturia nashicola]
MASSPALDPRTVIAAIASPSTCTASTTADLRQLLNPGLANKPTRNGKENPGNRTGRKPGTLAVAPKPSALKGRTQRKVADAIPAPDESPELSPREKLNLAFEAVNAALKTLSQLTKDKPAQIVKTRSPSVQSIRSPASRSQKPAAAPKARHPLKSRSPNNQRNNPSSDEAQASPAQITAECARAALEHIREQNGPIEKHEKNFQVENGMLALIGKCIAHNLESLALKELRILKRRLATYIGETGEGQGNVINSAKGVDPERESIADLLHFEEISEDSLAAPLVIGHQLHVVKLLIKIRQPRTTEAALKYLDMNVGSSPANLLLHQAHDPKTRSKSARQLEIFAQSLLSMCPSVATADDPVAINPRFSISPEVAFQIQSLAFRVRISWWCLAAHKPDVEKELWNPLLKSLATFSRRANLAPSRKYEMAASNVREIEAGLDVCLRSIKTMPSPEGTKQLLPAIYRALSQLAQAANLTTKAMELTNALSPSKENSSVESVSAARTIRLATIGIASKDGEALIRQALTALLGNLNGNAAAMDSLLIEVAGLRRASLKIFQEEMTEKENGMPSPIGKLCCEVVFASLHFLVQYMGNLSSSDSVQETAEPCQEKRRVAEKVYKVFIESVFLCCKRCIPISVFSFDTVDSVLQDCITVIKQLQPSEDANDEHTYQFHQTLQFPFVRISNNYYNFAMQESKSEGSSSALPAVALRRSIEVLRGRTAMERGSGLLATKLERLSTLLHDSKRYDESYRFIEETLHEHLASGLVRSAAEEAARSSLHALSHSKGPTSMLARALRRSHQILLKIRDSHKTDAEVLDDDSMPLEERGLLLELQLHIAGQDVLGRHVNETNLSRVSYLVHTLFEIYNVEDFPIRRLRVAVFTSRLVTQHPGLLHDDVSIILDECTQPSKSLGQDIGLYPQFEHLCALLRVTLAFRSQPVEIHVLNESLKIWRSISESSQDRSARIDDVAVWVSSLGLISDFFELQGFWHQAVLSLDMLSKATEMLPDPDPAILIKSLIRQGMCNLTLGYSGKAGHLLEKARLLLNRDGVGPEMVLKWHVAHAEYLLAIGNVERCGQTLAQCELVAAASPDVYQTSGPGGTVSSRMRAKRLVADASYVYSIYSMEIGDHAAAFHFSRLCCKLNQSVWTTMETQQSSSQAGPTTTGTDTEVDRLTKSMNGLSTSMFGRPVVVSTTHAALRGPTFWSLIPALSRGLLQLSAIYLHHGCFIEATHNALQAKKIADTVASPSGIITCATSLASLYVRSGRVDKAQERFDEAAAVAEDVGFTKEKILYNSVAAIMWRAREEFEDEIECWDGTIQAINKLIKDASRGGCATATPTDEDLVDKLAGLQLQPDPKLKRGTKTRGPATKSVLKPRATKATKAAAEPPRSAEDCTPLLALRGSAIRQKIATILQNGDDAGASALMAEAEECQSSQGARINHATTKFRILLREATRQIASNLTFGALTESTIALPALARSERRSSHQLDSSNLAATTQKKGTARSTKKAPVKKTAVAKTGFAVTLQAARDCLLEYHQSSLRTSPIDTFRELSELLGASSILLSATEHIQPKSFVHPLSNAYYLDLPSIHSSCLEQSVLKIENETVAQKDKTLKWPTVSQARFEETAVPSATQFKEDYIDILPESWTTISISLDQAKGELLLTRYRCGQSPLILRLPMARHQSRDLDEDAFDFTAGKNEIKEIADLANFSAHDARDMSKKGAKTQWWAEREALDLRLKEVLLNIENIWLGGFRGIFAQDRCDPQALANFQSDLFKIMGRHLPSRQGRVQPKAIKLDPRILELFTGLGDPDEEENDIDEALTDLMYFVVDILQFNGERNAYDEIGFDAMVIETIDALKTYHSSAEIEEEDTHTILILDKCLHGIPWESLPSLRGQSISRVPSLAALRHRILLIESSQVGVGEAREGRFYASRSSGSSILNPSGDLKSTQETIQPLLQTLPDSWTHSLSAQDERGFASLLANNEIMLYFGHGCGSQYIRSRAVKKLALAEAGRVSTCATTWLMGCSSAVVNENGVFEPDGMALAYITAGAPAVVGTLWDVTDKDCDRASVKAGELWGLWDIPAESTSKISKGKGKEVETARNGGVAARRKLFESKAKEDVRMKRGVSPEPVKRRMDLSRAVARGRESCYLKYLNGAAMVTYGIPVYLRD